jgi:hypothetical protein
MKPSVRICIVTGFEGKDTLSAADVVLEDEVLVL